MSQQQVIERELDAFSGAFELVVTAGDATLVKFDFANPAAQNVVLRLRRFADSPLPAPPPAAPPSPATFEPPLPQTTAELAAWLKHYSESTCRTLYGDVSAWGRKQGFRGSLRSWPDDCVGPALDRAIELLNLSAPPKPIVPDPTTGRANPLSLQDNAFPDEVADAKKRLESAGVNAYSLAQKLCEAAGDEGYAPYLQGQIPTYEQAVEQVAMLYCFFPNWVKATAKEVIQKLKREAASRP